MTGHRTGWLEWCLACWIALAGVVGAAVVADPPTTGPAAPPPGTVLTRAHARAMSSPRSGVSQDAGPEALGDPVRLQAHAISLDVPLVPVGHTSDGALDVPPFGRAGWFAPGPRPGEAGPAVIAGHVDSVDGPDVFHRLQDLQAGDELVVIDGEGTRRGFVVSSVEESPKDALPVARIWDGASVPALRLITCTGTFDRASRQYESNLIVYARARQPGVR